MTARDILEVLYKGEVDSRTAHRTDHGDGLRSDLLRDDNAKARGDLRQKTDENGAPSRIAPLSRAKSATSTSPRASMARTAK